MNNVNLIQKLEYTYTLYEMETSQRQTTCCATKNKIQNIKNLQTVFYDKGLRLEINKNKLSM